MNIFLFLASIDTTGVNEAFTATSVGGSPILKLNAALLIVLMLLISSGKKSFEIEIPRNKKELITYLKSVWCGEEKPNPPS